MQELNKGHRGIWAVCMRIYDETKNIDGKEGKEKIALPANPVIQWNL